MPSLRLMSSSVFLVTIFYGQAAPSAADSCSASHNVKVECGYYGITADQCKAKGCCWQPTSPPSIPWCYSPAGGPSPTPPPTPPPPTPPSPPAPGLAGCKASTKYQQDEQLCEDFYDEQIGIAWSVISNDVWKLQGPTWGFDRAVFSAMPPATPVNEEAMSNGHYKKGSSPYPNAGSPYGVIMSINPSSNFWQYSWGCDPGVIAADCKDRSAGPFPGSNKITICNPPYRTMADLGFTYEQWRSQVNAIVDITGTPDCAWTSTYNYNEFDASGFSSSAMAGIFSCSNSQWHHYDQPFPDDGTVCRFLANRGLQRQDNQWPLWNYQPGMNGDSSSALSVERYINCGSFTNASTVVV